MRRHAELVRLALLLVGDQPTAEDVVQDVFARLHTRLERLQHGDVQLLRGRRAGQHQPGQRRLGRQLGVSTR
jgi:hypothetical protein